MQWTSFKEYAEDSCDYGEAMIAASDWHSGQWSALYMLSCNQWQYWNASDIRAMIVEYEEEEETKDYARTMEIALALFIADYGDDEV